MKERYRLFLRRKSVYYAFDTKTKHFENLSLARVYLKHSDPQVSQRTWQHVFDEIIKTKNGNTQYHWKTAAKDKAFDVIRQLLVINNRGNNCYLTLDFRASVKGGSCFELPCCRQKSNSYQFDACAVRDGL